MKMDKVLKEKVAYYFFYAGVMIEIMLVLIDKSAYTNPIEGQIFRLTFLLFLMKVCLTKYSAKEYAVIIFFLAIGVVSYFTTGRNEILRTMIFIAACKDIDMVKCLKLVFWMTLTGCTVIILLSLTGIFGAMSLTQDYGRGSMETRYVLGMGHPNALQCMVCVLTMLGMYLYHDKWKWYYYVLAFLANAFFFILTDSKTGFLVAGGTIFSFFLISVFRNQKPHSKLTGHQTRNAAKLRGFRPSRQSPNIHASTSTWLVARGNKNMIRIFAAGNIGIFAGSILISVMSAKDAMCLWDYYWWGITDRKTNFYLFLDRMLTGRIHSLIETDNHEGIMSTWSLFSRPENNYYFDMGWVRLFYWYGIIPAVLAIIVLAGFMVYFVKKERWEEMTLFSMLALYTVVEAHIVSVYLGRNYLLFIIGMYWWKLKERQKE